MNAHEQQTAFLKHCLRYEDPVERHRLEERITRVQRDERCVRRAVWLMAILAALAMAGLCYAGVFLVDYPLNSSQLATRLVIKVFCALGVSSLICLLAFVALGVLYRQELDQRREECRRRATRLLESRLGQPPALPGTPPETITEDAGEGIRPKPSASPSVWGRSSVISSLAGAAKTATERVTEGRIRSEDQDHKAQLAHSGD